MLCLSVLVTVGMTGMCLGTSFPDHEKPLCPSVHYCNTSDHFGLWCSCDATCRIYGDCCLDSEYYDQAEQIKAVNDYACVPYEGEYDTDHVYMKVRCSEDWDNAEVQALCLKGNSLPDPTKRLAVTSTTTARTYVNHYCAICNGEDPAFLRMWFAVFHCGGRLARDYSIFDYADTSKDYAVVSHDGTWGVIEPPLGLPSFRRCFFRVAMPEDIRKFTTRCKLTVTTCDPGSEEHEKTLCQSYAAPVYHYDTRFRNQHCASCNGYKDYECVETDTEEVKVVALAMLLDFTDRTGSNIVGLRGPCGPEEVWDKTSGKCREIICSKPGEQFSYGRCVPAEDDTSLSTKKQELLCLFHHSCLDSSPHDRECSCDTTCMIYGDCCRDYHGYFEAEQMKNVNEYMCVGHVYMRGKCSEGWDNAEVQSLCLKGNTLPDPTKRLPVTNTTTALTYVNHYCAICNGEDPASLRMWYIKVTCDGLPPASVGNPSDDGYLITKDYDNVDSEYNDTMHNEGYKSLFSNDYDIVINDGTWGISLSGSGVSSFIPCKSDFAMPSDIHHFTRHCVPTVTTCSDPGSEEHEWTLCQSYAAPVYHGDLRFRNQHCASCNGYKEYSCEADPPTLTPPLPFDLKIIFDLKNHTSLTGSCGTKEAWDQYSHKCRKILCRKPDEAFLQDRCVPAEDRASPSSEVHSAISTTGSSAIYKSTTVDRTQNVGSPRIAAPPPLLPTAGSAAKNPTAPSTRKTNSSHPLPASAPNTSVPVSQDPQDHFSLPPNTTPSYEDCMKVLLSEEEFIRQPNESVYVPANRRTYQAGEYEVREGGVLVCWPADSSHKFSRTLGWVNLAGLCFSCLALVLHLTAFCLMPSLKNLSGKCLASLCISLLAAYMTLLLNMLAPLSKAGCTALAAATYYFFICSFSWMTTIAFDVWYTFRLTLRELRVAGGSQSHRFQAYSLCSWLLPAVCVAVLVTVDQLEPQGVSEDFLPRLGEASCWFSHRKSLLVFFATPMAVLTLMNVVFFAGTAALIAKMTRSAATPTAAAGQQRPKLFWTFLRLAVLMGLTWTTGIMAGYLDLEALWYIFVVLNSMQGVFIFLAFTCRTKVFQAVGFRGGRLLQRAVSLMTRRPLQPDNSMQQEQEMTQPSQISSSLPALRCEK